MSYMFVPDNRRIFLHTVVCDVILHYLHILQLVRVIKQRYVNIPYVEIIYIITGGINGIISIT